MEWYLIAIITVAIFFIGFFLGGKIQKNKDDGIAIINEERVEVIFRDPYEKLVRKRYVRLKIES